MNNPQTPAPRPCTLWGSTFPFTCYDDFILEHEITKDTVAAILTDISGKEIARKVLSKSCKWQHIEEELYCALHHARHPWLDAQDAVEKGLIESGKRYVYIMDDGNMHHHYRFEHPLIKGFIPPSWLPCPSRDPEKIKAHADQATADRLRFACVKTAEGV